MISEPLHHPSRGVFYLIFLLVRLNLKGGDLSPHFKQEEKSILSGLVGKGVWRRICSDGSEAYVFWG